MLLYSWKGEGTASMAVACILMVMGVALSPVDMLTYLEEDFRYELRRRLPSAAVLERPSWLEALGC